jgi:hypothetical protein
MGSKVNTATQVALDKARIAGVQKHCAGQASIRVANVSYTPAQVCQIYQADLDAKLKVAAAVTALKGLRYEAKRTTLARAKFDVTFVRAVLAAFGGAVSVLNDFGLREKPRKKPSALVRAKGVVKAKATKALRYPKPDK